MSKHKYGRHITSLGPAAKATIRTISELGGVSRVLVGHIRSGRGKSAPSGYARVQRRDAHVVHLAMFDDNRLITVSAILGPEADPDVIVAQIESLWPEAMGGDKPKHQSGRFKETSPSDNRRRHENKKVKRHQMAIATEEPFLGSAGFSVADFWPQRSDREGAAT